MEDIIYRRHSTRQFTAGYTISHTAQEKILQAGLRAPSPKNRQPWAFVVLDQENDRDTLCNILAQQVTALKKERESAHRDASDLDMALTTAQVLRGASMIVLVEYVRDASQEHGERMDWPITAQAFEVADLQAIGACVENMLLAAEEMGIASLWVCDILYAQRALTEAFACSFPLVAVVAFGKAAPYVTPRYTLREKVRWFSENPEERDDTR